MYAATSVAWLVLPASRTLLVEGTMRQVFLVFTGLLFACSSTQVSGPTGSQTERGTEKGDAQAPVEQVEAGEATECGPAIWFRDADGDGYGEKGTVARAVCGDKNGYVQNDLDCADEDPRARPNQATPQSTPIVGLSASGPFDFNCDGVEQKSWTGFGTCKKSNNACVQNGAGWANAEAACGTKAGYMTYCFTTGPTGCDPESDDRVQTCL